MFPKPEKKKKSKRNREIDTDYVRWIHGWPCCICSKYPVDAHHVVTRGAMGSDRTCLPICHYHHLGWIHSKGSETTERHFGVSFLKLVEKFNALYEAKEKGPFDHLAYDVGPSRLTVS